MVRMQQRLQHQLVELFDADIIIIIMIVHQRRQACRPLPTGIETASDLTS